MSAEEITLENLTPGLLAQSANEFCIDCNDLRMLASDVLDELPATEDIDPALIVGRFAGFAALCDRDVSVPAAQCNPGLCGSKDKARGCELKELLMMTPEERAAKVMELSAID